MAKKRKKTKSGDALFDHLVSLTGIPSTHIKQELKDILEKKNIDVKNLTLEQLRTVAASYLREIMAGIIDKYHLRRHDSQH